MTQLLTGTGLGLHGSSLDQLKHYSPKGSASLGQGGCSVYVNASNGNLLIKQCDGFLSNAEASFNLFQSYNSRSSEAWRFSTDTHLVLQGAVNSTSSTVLRTDEDGHTSRFVYDSREKAYFAEDGSITKLTFNGNEWAYQVGNDQATYYYTAEGQLSRINDHNGHALNFIYENGRLTTVNDTNNKQTITWSFDQGQLREVTFKSNGQIVHHLHYDYDAQHRLNRISRDLGDGKTYWVAYDYFDDSNLISDIRQSDGTNVHIDYDAESRIKRIIDGEGRSTSYDYLFEKTIVTDGLGEHWTYHYDANARLTGIDGPEQFHIRYDYEGKYLHSITQGNQRWTFDYNDRGDCIRIKSPTGELILRTYDSEHRLLTETHYQQFDNNHQPSSPQTSRFIYDQQGHLRFEIAADGVVTENRYDANGYRTSRRCYMQGRYSNQETTLDALMAWSKEQDQQAISLTEYQHDWRGCLSEEISYTTINKQGEGLSTSDTIRTYSQHDAAGRLIEQSSVTPNGLSTTHFIYDGLGRLIKTIDNQQHTQTIDYDDTHQRIIKTDANGLTTQSIYDKSGLLLSTQQLDSAKEYGTKTYQYDTAGQLIAETDVTGKTRHLFYDARGRLQGVVSFNGHVTEYLYDDDDHCIQTHLYQQAIHFNAETSFAAIKPATTNNDRINQVIYNQYHQIAYFIDPEGAVISVQYDPQGRLTTKTAFALRLKNYQPNTLLNAADITLTPSQDDRTLSYYYDRQGRLQAEINGEGNATAYRYDAQGHLIESRHFANAARSQRTCEWLIDAPIEDNNNDLCTYSLYNSAGLKIADIDPEGYLTEYSYDARGLLTKKIAWYTRLQSPFLLDDSSTLNAIRPLNHANDHQTTYGYNDLNQLIEESSSSGLVITYAYNIDGHITQENRTDRFTHDTRSQTYRYDALGRIVQSLDAQGAALLAKTNPSNPVDIETIWQQHSVRFTYDIAGHLLSKTNALNETTQYIYNDAGLLHYTISPTGAVTEHRYNDFQQIETTLRYSTPYPSHTPLNLTSLQQFIEQAANSTQDEVTHYEYNTLGLLISQHQNNGSTHVTTYNAFGEQSQTAERTPNTAINNIRDYQYDRRGLLQQRIDDVGGINKTFRTHYDAFSRIEKEWDGRDIVTLYSLNKRGDRVTIKDQQDRTIKSMQYDAFGRLLSVHDKNRIVYTYDDQNNTLTLNREGLASTIITQFNALGDTLSITDGNHQTTTYQYDALGQLIHINAPEGSSTDYTYDAAGRLTLQEDGNGHVQRFTYDASGHVLTKTVDPDGLNITTSYTYDALGHQLQVIDAHRCTQFSYDNQGNLIRISQDPNGLNLITTLDYNESGQLIREIQINPQGKDRITTYTRDALGRKLTQTLDPDGLHLTTRYAYDENDNIISQTDPKQNVTHYTYDSNNRLHYSIDAKGAVTEHSYDLHGNEIKTSIYAHQLVLNNHADDATIAQMIQPDIHADHHQFFAYDQQGRRILSYDGLGYATEYSYDANDNIVSQEQYDTPCSFNALVNGLFPTPTTQGHSRKTQFIYDGLNHERFRIHPNGQVTEFRYDLSGQLIQQTRFAHAISSQERGITYTLETIQTKLQINPEQDQSIHYAYDKANRLSYQATAAGAVTAYEYDDCSNQTASHRYFSLLTATQLNDSNWPKWIESSSQDRITRSVYDAAGRAIYRISPSGHVVERGYDAVGNVLFETAHSSRWPLNTSESEAHLTAFQYDAIGRLLSQTDAAQHTTRYTYDENNNVATKTEANDAQWQYRYNALNQLIETISPATTVHAFINGSWHEELRTIIRRNEYDSFGNLIQEIQDFGGQNRTIQYTYDNNNRKISTSYPNVTINNANQRASNARQEITQTLNETSVYNAFGELIEQRDRAGHSSHYAYDLLGQQIFAIQANGAVTGFQYDHLGNLCTKTTYATCLNSNDYSIDGIASSLQKSSLDRHEYYVYDQERRLIEARKDPVRSYNPRTERYQTLSPTTRLTYNAFGDTLTQAIQQSDVDWSLTTHTYDIDGLKIASLDAEHYLTTYHYNAFGLLDEQTDYATQGASPALSPNDRTVTFLYDVKGQLVQKTLKNVSVSRLIGQSNRYESMITDLTSHYGYDAMGNIVSTTDAAGHTAYSYYNTLGQLITKVGVETPIGRAATTYRYDALGQQLEIHQWLNGAHLSSEAQLVFNPASSSDMIQRNVYNANGQLAEKIDGTGHVTHYSYDANGNIARSWHPLNQSIISDKHYRYDEQNHLIQTLTLNTEGVLATDDIHYNVFGDIIKKGINGHITTQVDYDNAGRAWRSNVQGYFQIYLYDLCDHMTQVLTATQGVDSHLNELGIDLSSNHYTIDTDFNLGHALYDLQRHDNTYDALGHVIAQAQRTEMSTSEPHAVMTTTQQVDRWGNVLSSTNARGYTTRYNYNALNVITEQILPEVAVVDEQGVSRTLAPVNHYAIDHLGHTIAITDANGHTIAHVFDAEGRITQDIDAKGNHRNKTYNLLGQMTTQTNERGGITSYTYDAKNRLVSVITTQTAQSYDYNADDQLIHQTDATGNEQTMSYDELGHLVQKTGPNGTTTYEYDAIGHKTAEHDANGKTNRWRYDDNGHMQEHTDLGGHQTQYTYNTNGLVLTEQSSAGKNIHYNYYSDGRLREYVDAANHETVKYTYDIEGNVSSKFTQRPNALEETDYYEYDALGRMSHAKRRSPYYQITGYPSIDRTMLAIDYEYDAVGNIRDTYVLANYSNNQDSGHSYYFRYDENNRVMINKGLLINSQITINAAQGNVLAYDANGNIEDAQTFENGVYQHYSYHYNNENQLEIIRKNDRNMHTKSYSAGLLREEKLFNDKGMFLQNNKLSYDKGRLLVQTIETPSIKRYERIVKTIVNTYDNVGNITTSTHAIFGRLLDTHSYDYELWDSYLQKTDTYVQHLCFGKTTFTKVGTSTHTYDINGLLKDVMYCNLPYSNTHYVSSHLEGVRTRTDSSGQTNYLSIEGKTVADVHVENQHTESLTVYGATTLPSSQEDNLNAYTANAGDTLDSIALRVYGDSSLWYLIADANGITDRFSHAGEKGGQLHVGMRLNLPAIAKGQHYTNEIQRNISYGDVTTPLFQPPTISRPPPLPSFHKKQSDDFWKTIAKITVVVTAAVTMVLSAGAFAILAAGTSLSGIGIGALISTGLSALGGTALAGIGTGAALGMTSTLIVGFAAGFTSSIAGQTVANLLHLQNGIDMKGALLTALGTAATAGVSQLFNASQGYALLRETLQQSSPPVFNIISATEMMERDAITQGLNLALNRHQHFDWMELAISSATAGVMGSQTIQKVGQWAQQKGGRLGTAIFSEAQAVATGAATGNFDALQILEDNLGSSISAGLLQQPLAPTEAEQTPRPQDIEEGGYCPIPTQTEEDGAYSAIPEGTWERFHREHEMRKHFEQMNAQYMNNSADTSNETFNGEGVLGILGDVAYNSGYKLPVGEEVGGLGTLSNTTHSIKNKAKGLYDIDYSSLIVNQKGSPYKKDKIVKYSNYYKSPGSPIWGDASKELQINAIDALITTSHNNGLNARDTAHVLAIARHESGFNPFAAAGTTSASGVGQFINTTGKEYGIFESNKWDVNVQANALVKHFIDNKMRAKGLPEAYIYKFHHDGPQKNYGGLKISLDAVVPKIRGFQNVIQKLF